MSDILELANAINNLADAVRGLVKSPPTHIPASPTAMPQVAPPPATKTKTFKCPECESPMILRTRRSDGQEFYGCSRYPNCRGARDIKGKDTTMRESPIPKDDDCPF